MAAGIHVMREITHVAMQATDSIGMECCVEVRASFYEIIYNIMTRIKFIMHVS